MKITLNRKILLAALLLVKPAIKTRSTLPILSCVHLAVSAAGLTITATDLHLRITRIIQGNYMEPGEICIPFKRLLKIATELPDEIISIGSTDLVTGSFTGISIVSETATVNIYGLSADEFQQDETFPAPFVRMEHSFFKSMFRKVEPAISQDQSRYILNGVCWEFTTGKLRCMATDGRRLHLIERPMEASEMKTLVIAPRNLRALANMPAKEISMAASEDFVYFQDDDWSIKAKHIAGKYPNVNPVIPKEPKHHVAVDRLALFRALRIAYGMMDTKYNSVKLIADGGKLEVLGRSMNEGDASIKIPIAFTGSLQFAVNPIFLMPVLERLEQKEVTLDIESGESPMTIRENEFLAVIMPMRERPQ